MIINILNWMDRVISVVSWIQTVQKLCIIGDNHSIVFTPQKISNSAPDYASSAKNI